MGILEFFGKRPFGQEVERTAKQHKKIEETLQKKKRRKSKKRAESFFAQKEAHDRKRKKKKSTQEYPFSEPISVPQKRSWQEVIQQQKLVIFPITRNEFLTTLSSVKALQEAILERRPDVPFRSDIQSGDDYKKILQRWLSGVDDNKIALFDTFLHRSNAQASRTEIGEDLLQVIQDSFRLVHSEKQQRQSFLFRAAVLQQANELIRGKKGIGDGAHVLLPGPDEFFKKIHTSLSEMRDVQLEKFDVFLRKAQEISDTPEKKKAIDAVTHDVRVLIENEKKGRSSYAYRGKILTGIEAGSRGGIASREEFREKLTAWLKTAELERITPLEQTIRLARGRMAREKVSEDVRSVIQDAEALLSEELSRRKAEEILRKIVPLVPPPEEIQKVLMPIREEGRRPEGREDAVVQSSELRARILQRIGSPDTEVAVGQKYFENRLHEWMQFPTTTDQQKQDALKDIQEELREIESDSGVRKRTEKIKIFQRAEDILGG